MKSKQHIPPQITKKNSHQAKDTKMNIDEKGKGKEKEIMIEEGSMKKSGMSTTFWFTYHNKLINYWISDESKIELGETYSSGPARCTAPLLCTNELFGMSSWWICFNFFF